MFFLKVFINKWVANDDTKIIIITWMYYKLLDNLAKLTALYI